MLGDHHAAVLALQAVYDLREPVLYVREGHLLSNRHGHKYSYFCVVAGSHLVSLRARTCHLRHITT
jgi:hypothetical protein